MDPQQRRKKPAESTSYSPPKRSPFLTLSITQTVALFPKGRRKNVNNAREKGSSRKFTHIYIYKHVYVYVLIVRLFCNNLNLTRSVYISTAGLIKTICCDLSRLLNSTVNSCLCAKECSLLPITRFLLQQLHLVKENRKGKS